MKSENFFFTFKEKIKPQLKVKKKDVRNLVFKIFYQNLYLHNLTCKKSEKSVERSQNLTPPHP